MSDDNEKVLSDLFKDQVKNKQSDQEEFHMVVVLDRSGSMSSIRADAIGAVNTYIEEQKKEGGNAYLSIIQFDNQYGDPSFWCKPIMEVELLTDKDFVPRGYTALFDAIGITVQKVREMREKGEMSGKVQLVVQTDGGENASKEYTTRQGVADMVTAIQEEGWGDVIFLGANIDAFGEGSSFGINAARTVNFQNSGVGVRGASYAASAMTKSFRYAQELDSAAIFNMQEAAAKGEDLQDLYEQIDANIDRS